MTDHATDPLGDRRRTNRVIASPRARRAMRRTGLDPETVRGTGPGGRIVEADVLRVGETGRREPTASSAGSGISPMRRAVAEKVTESFSTVPHFYLCS